MHLLTSQMLCGEEICRFSHCSRVSTVVNPFGTAKLVLFQVKLVCAPSAQLTCEQVTNTNGNDTWRAI